MDTQKFNAVSLLRDIAVVATINNKSEIKFDHGSFTKYGDPTEVALKVAAEKLGQYDSKLGSINYQQKPNAYGEFLSQQIKKVATLDFTSERKLMSTVVTGFNGNSNTLLIKGAPERVIEKCASYKLSNG